MFELTETSFDNKVALQLETDAFARAAGTVFLLSFVEVGATLDFKEARAAFWVDFLFSVGGCVRVFLFVSLFLSANPAMAVKIKPPRVPLPSIINVAAVFPKATPKNNAMGGTKIVSAASNEPTTRPMIPIASVFLLKKELVTTLLVFSSVALVAEIT